MEKQITALVLQQKDDRENNMVLSLLSENGVEDVIAKGIKKLGAKNKAACQLFVLSEFSLAYPNERARGVVTIASVLKDYRLSQDLLAVAIMSFVAEMLSRYFRETDYYHEVLELALSLHNKAGYWFNLCWLIKGWIIDSGIQPRVDGCYNCGNKMVVALSFEGGLVCEHCCHSYDLKCTKKQLQLFSYLFKASDQDKEKLAEWDYDWLLVDVLMKYYLH